MLLLLLLPRLPCHLASGRAAVHSARTTALQPPDSWCDALVKVLYDRLFNYLVRRVNDTVLDVAVVVNGQKAKHEEQLSVLSPWLSPTARGSLLQHMALRLAL